MVVPPLGVENFREEVDSRGLSFGLRGQDVDVADLYPGADLVVTPNDVAIVVGPSIERAAAGRAVEDAARQNNWR